MKALSCSLKIAFVIAGSIIGAGFLSGKEIYTFFSGTDILMSTLSLFLMFFLSVFFILRTNPKKNSRFYRYFRYIIFLADFLIMCGMVSGIDALFSDWLPIFQNFPLPSLLCLIISSIVCMFGTDGLKSISSFTVPLIITVIIFIVFIPCDKAFTAGGTIKTFSIASYVGLNVILMLPLVSEIGEGRTTCVSFLTALFSSIIISLLVCMLSSVMACGGIEISDADLPIATLLSDMKSNVVIYCIVLFFGILTTLFNTNYALFSSIGDSSAGIPFKIIVTVLCFVVSRLGFNEIVSVIYPVLGSAGLVALLIFVGESVFFRLKRPQNTSMRQAGKG